MFWRLVLGVPLLLQPSRSEKTCAALRAPAVCRVELITDTKTADARSLIAPLLDFLVVTYMLSQRKVS